MIEQGHHVELMAGGGTSVDAEKGYTITIHFNYMVHVDDQYRTLTSTTTIKNSPTLADIIGNLASAYCHEVHLPETPQRTKILGGGRVELRQGRYLILGRFSIDEDGQICEMDKINHSLGRILEKVGFAKRYHDTFLMKSLLMKSSLKGHSDNDNADPLVVDPTPTHH